MLFDMVDLNGDGMIQPTDAWTQWVWVCRSWVKCFDRLKSSTPEVKDSSSLLSMRPPDEGVGVQFLSQVS